MEILVIHETVEGQSRKIAEAIGAQIEAAGHGLRRFDAADRLAPLSFDGIDRVILVAPVHERRHPEGFELLVSTSLKELHARPTLMVSVSLKAAFPDWLDEAQDYLTEMEMRTKFSPTREHLAAGAIRKNSYSYYESLVVQNVALEGRDVELVDGVHEFTDWDALSSEVNAFLS